MPLHSRGLHGDDRAAAVRQQGHGGGGVVERDEDAGLDGAEPPRPDAGGAEAGDSDAGEGRGEGVYEDLPVDGTVSGEQHPDHH